MVAAEAHGGRPYPPGDTIVAQTMADDFRDPVLLGNRLRDIAQSRCRKIPSRSALNRRKDGPSRGLIIATERAPGYRRGAGTVRLKSMRCRTLTDMHDRDVVGVEPVPSRQIIEEPCRRGIGVEQCPGN